MAIGISIKDPGPITIHPSMAWQQKAPKNMSDFVCSSKGLAKLENVIFRVQYLIKIYASSQEMRPEVLATKLSEEVDIHDLQWLIGRLEMADFSILPAVEVRSRFALAGAWSRYVPEVNTIYLAGDFVENASKAELNTVLLQEIINAMRKFM